MSMFFAGRGGKVAGRRALPLELGEDEVPDLRALLRRVEPAGVVEDLAARPADAVRAVRGGAGRPEVVVLPVPPDTDLLQPHLLPPDRGGLVVVLVDGDVQFARVHPEPLLVGQELPRPEDRLPLEVVPEAEVPEHLEERVVPGGDADVADVPGPQALLAGRRAPQRRVAGPEKLRLELVHPGGGEQHAGVVLRDEHVAGLTRAALALEKVEIGGAEVVGLHRSASFRRRREAARSSGGGGGAGYRHRESAPTPRRERAA